MTCVGDPSSTILHQSPVLPVFPAKMKLVLLGALIGWSDIVAAKPLQLSQNMVSSTQVSPNISSPSNLGVQCDATEYGSNPSIEDCWSALANLPPIYTKVTFMDRSQGVFGEDIYPLPLRVYGCKFSFFNTFSTISLHSAFCKENVRGS